MSWNKNTVISCCFCKTGIPYVVVNGYGLNDTYGDGSCQYFLRYMKEDGKYFYEVIMRDHDCDGDDIISINDTSISEIEEVVFESYFPDPNYEEGMTNKVKLIPLIGPFFIIGKQGDVSTFVHFIKETAEKALNRLKIKNINDLEIKELSLGELAKNISYCKFKYKWE